MHPVAFRIGSHIVYWYGVLVMLACVAGELLLLWRAKREGVAFDMALLWIILLLLGGGGGAWLAGVIRGVLSGGTINSPAVRSGMVSYGAPVGVLLVGLLYARVAGLSLWKQLDLVVPSIALGFAITRVGCFLSGCCYGNPTTLPWGVVFPSFSPAGMAFGRTPLHPVQLYSSLGNWALFVGLLALQRRQRFEGFLCLSWVALYAGLRFVLELFRAEPRMALGLTAAQWVNLVIGPLALVLLLIKGRGARAGFRSE